MKPLKIRYLNDYHCRCSFFLSQRKSNGIEALKRWDIFKTSSVELSDLQNGSTASTIEASFLRNSTDHFIIVPQMVHKRKLKTKKDHLLMKIDT